MDEYARWWILVPVPSRNSVTNYPWISFEHFVAVLNKKIRCQYKILNLGKGGEQRRGDFICQKLSKTIRPLA